MRIARHAFDDRTRRTSDCGVIETANANSLGCDGTNPWTLSDGMRYYAALIDDGVTSFLAT